MIGKYLTVKSMDSYHDDIVAEVRTTDPWQHGYGGVGKPFEIASTTTCESRTQNTAVLTGNKDRLKSNNLETEQFQS